MHPIMWKLIVGENPTIQDLESVDHVVGAFLTRLVTWTSWGEEAQEAQAEFRAEFPLQRFVDPADGRTPLIADGASISVTLANRSTFAKLALQKYTSQYRVATRAIREGMSLIVPDRALGLCPSRTLRALVCGNDMIDVDVLRRHTRYGEEFGLEYNADTDVVKFFWEVFADMSNRER